MATVTGWIFDAYPSERGITLWFIDRAGAKHRCASPFTPFFFVHPGKAETRRIADAARTAPARVSAEPVVQKDLFRDTELEVVRISVHNPLLLRKTVTHFEKFFPHYAFYTSDLMAAQQFFYHTDLFPLAYGDYYIDEHGTLTGWDVRDSRDALEYDIPPLSIMTLKHARDFVPAKYFSTLQLELSYDGTTYTLEQESPAELLYAFNYHLRRCDPDILLTEYGDGTLLPRITDLARKHRIPLALNRDLERGYTITRESSFVQYGQVIHKDAYFELAGRWHIDADNSFTIEESDLDGLFEIARVTQMPPQRQARSSIGTGLSSLQLSWAYRNGYLIPAKKREPEEFKTAATLLLADRGGLIYQPPVGYHEEVAELDFVSMYPSIMVNRNVSPETINCSCCAPEECARVPELGYHICRRREGIVPATLRTIVKKRSYYKKKRKEYKGKDERLHHKYDCRQNVLKWMLVSCFGYLGYKNARFGRIEAHESVNAFSRDAILTAKEIAEEQGYHLLHAIIDCVWLKKDGATESDYEELAAEIGRRVGIDISLEGIYSWIVFPASKMDASLPTANRYAGWYRHGEFKIRGIESRRRDVPRFIKKMQQELLDELSSAASAAECRRRLPRLLEIAEEHLRVLRGGNAHPLELVLRRRITQEADDYQTSTVSAAVAKLSEEAGVPLRAGETVQFIIIDQSGKRAPEKAKPLALYALEDGYDVDVYTTLALKAVETLTLPFGWDIERLHGRFLPPKQKRSRAGAQKQKTARRQENGSHSCEEQIRLQFF